MAEQKELFYSLLEKYGKYVVHMRQQFKLGTSKLGIVLGAGISKNVGLPDWKELVKRIAQTDDIRELGIDIDLDGDPVSNAQMLFQAYKTEMLTHAEERDKAYNRIEMLVKAGWRKIIHNALYSEAPGTIEELVKPDDYLWSLVKVIKRTPMTVNYNFDDTLQRMLFSKKSDDDSRGYTTLWNTNIYICIPNRVLSIIPMDIYHIN